MKTYVFDPIHVLNVLLLVINCVFIALLVSACSANVAAPGYASLAPIVAPTLPASGQTTPVPTLTASEDTSKDAPNAAYEAASDTGFIAAMSAP